MPSTLIPVHTARGRGRLPRHAGATSSLWRVASLPEVRWAAPRWCSSCSAASLQLAGAPALVCWALYLACYAVGGLGAGLGRAAGAAARRPWTSTC